VKSFEGGKMIRTEAVKRAQAKYDKKYREKGLTKSYQLKCHKDNDADIIKVLESIQNKNGYIKGLIRKDIAKTKDGE
jgi:hypothetical protein